MLCNTPTACSHHDGAPVISRYSKEQIEEVIKRSPIKDIIGDYIPLKLAGKRFIAVCPFHDDKARSLSVNPEKDLWYCTGCHEGGNALHFLMKIKNIGFGEALKMAARRAGIVLEGSKENFCQ